MQPSLRKSLNDIFFFFLRAYTYELTTIDFPNTQRTNNHKQTLQTIKINPNGIWILELSDTDKTAIHEMFEEIKGNHKNRKMTKDYLK